MPADPTTLSLPQYDNPPVIETVLGVQFDRLTGLSNAHLGAFWKTLNQNEWPTVEDVALLPNTIERFTDAARWGAGLQIELTDDPSCRCRIKNRNRNRLIQVQNTRLHLNWLGDQGGKYPRYETMLAEFREMYRRFSAFAAVENAGNLKPNQWEITYVNHIPQGTVWESANDWTFLRLLGSGTTANVVRPEGFHGEWHFVIPEKRGRLHVEWQHSRKSPGGTTGAEVIRLVFTARGPMPPGDDSYAALMNGLNLGREVIVTSFRDLASDAANQYWGLKHGS